MLTIQEFCDKHQACTAGRRWALANCSSMQEAWDKCKKPDFLIWIATRPNVLDDKSLRLFAVWCCRQVQHLMKDPRPIAALDAAEQFANGLITANQLAAARKSAYAYATDAARTAAYVAAAYVTAYAAYAAAYATDAIAPAAAIDAACTAAYVTDYVAAAYVTAYAAYAATNKEARIKQMNYLRQNFKPNFA